jgi:hypothetical protein
VVKDRGIGIGRSAAGAPAALHHRRARSGAGWASPSWIISWTSSRSSPRPAAGRA